MKVSLMTDEEAVTIQIMKLIPAYTVYDYDVYTFQSCYHIWQYYNYSGLAWLLAMRCYW